MNWWDFSDHVIKSAAEYPIGCRVMLTDGDHLHGAVGTVVGVDIERHGRTFYTVMIDGEKEPLDNISGRELEECAIQKYDWC